MKTIQTQYGPLTPQHTTDDLRKKEILPVRYHANGTPKAIPLETQTVITTPVGKIPAELVTFHENGKLNRIFPLNGKLSGYWGEADEMELASPLAVQTPAGKITAQIIAISFHENRALRSITLWPGETVEIFTPAGPMEARIGLSFAPDGTLKSLEPAAPTQVSTIIGDITAFDPDAMGVNGDMNSLEFDSHGNVVSIATTLNRVSIVQSNGKLTLFEPDSRESYCSETESEPIPMTIKIGASAVSISRNPNLGPIQIPFANHVFFTEPYLPLLESGIKHLGCSV